MKSASLEDMIGGWFVGDFAPSVARSVDCEVAVKSYSEGAYEAAHFHRVATEITTIVSGRARMFDREWGPGDIVTIEPGEVTDFTALSDVVTVVVKLPSVRDDKFFA